MRRAAPKFLGRGWRFPPRFAADLDSCGRPEGEGVLAMVDGDEDIRESLAILMATMRGERLMRPNYGLGLQEHVFDPTDETTLGYFRSQIEEAILFYEPRIKVEAITFDSSDNVEGRLLIQIEYRVPATNSRSNMVFPFYFREGTNIRAL